MVLKNIILPFQDSSKQWDIQIEEGVVTSMKPSAGRTTPSVMLPSLCHPHIHLDKPYLLTCNHPKSSNHPDYSGLAPKTGGFQEALVNTAEAKKRYTEEDLYLRGSQLIATSYKQGVTFMRAFVEVDSVTELKTLEAGIRLKKEFEDFLEVQICAFAQDPIFSTEKGEANRAMFMKALDQLGSKIDVIGTTPYVESDVETQNKNIRWAIETALKHRKHLDFHIEFNLNGDGTHMSVFNHIIEELRALKWPTYPGAPTVVFGHATRLTRATHDDLVRLSETLRETKLPVHFVGLPTSDLYMIGRHGADGSEHGEPLSRPCGTIMVPKLIQGYGINACLSVNNVGNPFTPHGDGDPLKIASWGVGLFHAGTVEDAKILYEAISTRAMDALNPRAEGHHDMFTLAEFHQTMPMLLFKNEENIEISSASGSMTVLARQRLSIQDIVWDPPETRLRSIVE
ncbi:Cytosine deaminase [Fusarium oxysporum f. sp. cubense race 1]|uniref:Cytosine deaminase n=1 Tax=Fusarium oxysporum f. sp. cubense (strain race 1) TaxID=1229664 RepID=N4UD83_FUSC1|nr:Cytosine deaminase [Fusarium oxysporum f. sp. cubense race 1]